MSFLRNMEDMNLWSLRLTDLNTNVKAFDGYGEDRIGVLTKLRDDESYEIDETGSIIIQHLKRTATINGEDYVIWLSSRFPKEDL